jgi:DNA-binding transcriptional MerR regulator
MLEPMALRIGELARQTNLSRDSIRHYGRLGLVSSTRTTGKFREFTPDAVQRVRVIQAALELGFSLDELSQIFAMRRAGRAPCRHVRALAGKKLDSLTARIAELQRLRTALVRTLAAWDASLDVETEHPVRLLESLAARASKPRSRVRS